MSGNMCVTKYISILEVSTLTGFYDTSTLVYFPHLWI